MEAVAALWLVTLQEIMDRSAHEVKDSLNGVSLNLEVIRSRASRPDAAIKDVAAFAEAASGQFETLTARIEAMLMLARPPRSGPGDLAQALKLLSTLLVPAARADGRALQVEGFERSVPTAAPVQAVRLALASAMLALIKGSRTGRCTLESDQDPVVRFSHESAAACSLDPAVADAIAGCNIRTRRSDHDLLIVFPGP